MTINVLHLRDTTEIGGPGKTILETFAHIDGKRFAMHLGVFLTRSEVDDSAFIGEARRRGVNLSIVRSIHQYSPAIVGTLVRLIRELNIDILHTHEKKSDILGFVAARWAGIPVVATLHGWIRNDLKQKVFAVVDRWVIKRYDALIAVSEEMKNKIVRDGADPAMIHVLYNSILIDRYRRNGCRGYLSEVAGRPTSKPIVGTVGRLSPEKGHKDFIAAVAIVVRKGYKGSFFIVGDGPEMPHLREMIASHGLESRVFLTGYLRDPVRVYEDLDLMVLPSYTEGLPNVVLEAMAMEVPVIATRVGGTPEVIEDGENGILVPPGSPEDIARAMEEFLKKPDRYFAMVQSGKRTVETKFDFRERTRNLEAIYETIARKRPVPS